MQFTPISNKIKGRIRKYNSKSGWGAFRVFNLYPIFNRGEYQYKFLCGFVK